MGCRWAEGRLQGLLRGIKNRSTRAPGIVPTLIFSDWVERQKVLIVRDEETGRGVVDELRGVLRRRAVDE